MTEETINNPIRPQRWIDTSQINAGFDGNFAGKQIFPYQNKKCYLQKWQQSDRFIDQLLLDYVPSEVKFINILSGAVAYTANYAEVPTLVIGQTFKVYQIDISMTALPVGQYVAQWSYTDSNSVLHPIESEPFDVAVSQPNTILLRYKHSENDYDVIFDTQIEFQFRVEAAISDFDPRNNRVVYNDQKTNATQLSAAPYRKFTFRLGYQYGVPEWVLDKVNWIQSVDQIRYDGINYQIISGEEYEVDRNPDNGFVAATIGIQPVNNNFNKYQTQPDNTNEFIPMQKILRYPNQSTDLTIAGKFKYESLLEKICIQKYTPGQFTLKVGTTAGGNQIAEFVVDSDQTVLTIEELFAGTSTIYLSGINGFTCDIDVVYKQLDEPPIPDPVVPGGVSGVNIKTAAVYVELQPGDLAIDWDLATGLGRANTDYAGCAWMDGRNGTQDWRKRTPLMLDESDPAWNLTKVGTAIGSDTITIAKANLPAVGIGINVKTSSLDSWRVSGGSGRPIVGVGGVDASGEANSYTGSTQNLGSGTPLSYQPKGVVSLWYVRIN